MRATAVWDLAGVDAGPAVRALFGEAAARLSVWQSLDATWSGAPCAVLRLCERNFRIGLYGGDAEALGQMLEQVSHGPQFWVKPGRLAVWMAGDAVDTLMPVATVKPPHRLAGLPAGRAVPARLEDRAVLLWRHAVAGTPVLEVQTAPGDGPAVRETLCRGGLL